MTKRVYFLLWLLTLTIIYSIKDFMEVLVDVMNDEMGLSCLMGVKRQSRALTTHMTVYS